MVKGRVGHFSQTLATLLVVNNPCESIPVSDNLAGLNQAPRASAEDGFRAQAMLLAAGRGERMRPLTDTTPKPLLQVRGKPLLWYPLNALALAAVNTVVINTGWLGDQLEPALGTRFSPTLELGHVQPSMAANQLQLQYSHEGRGAGEALETAGGIVRALPLLADVFWVAAGDIYAPDFAFSPEAFERFRTSPQLAHLWLVPNPAHNPSGDFGLSADGLALNLPRNAGHHLFTFSTIALYKRAFFEAAWCPIPPGNPDGVKAPLAAMLRAAMDQSLVSASLYKGLWVDVGTPERLAQLNS
jgi:MurNAc alpha-1-phosphate uridylyltransferase